MTTATRVPGTTKYKLKGSKTWITNSPIADICLVWAKVRDSDSDDKVRSAVTCPPRFPSVPSYVCALSLSYLLTERLLFS